MVKMPSLLNPLLRFLLVISMVSSLSAQEDTLPGVDPMLDADEAVEFWAEVDEATPSITIQFLYAKDYELHRRPYGGSANEWVQLRTRESEGGGDTIASYTDMDVVVGQAYEYAAASAAEKMDYIAAGIRLDKVQSRGTIVLVMAENIIEHNTARIETLYRDLVGDGWKVRTVYTPTFGDTIYAGYDNAAPWTYGIHGHRYPEVLRNRIRAIHDEEADGVKLIYFLGHTPIAQTGTTIGHPDGHGSRAVYASDHYYGDIDGEWTDLNVNVKGAAGDIAQTTPNLPGDGIWDQSHLPSEVEIGFGRVDPWDKNRADWFETPLNESERIARYLDKAHKYRHLEPFGYPGMESVPGRAAKVRGGGSGQVGTFHASARFLSYVGPQNMIDFTRQYQMPTAVAPADNADVQLTIDDGPLLFYGQNSSGPTENDAGRMAVFNHAMQSWWGDWHAREEMRKATMDDNMVLSWLYAGRWDGQYFNHGMGIGEPIGVTMLTAYNYEQEEIFSGRDPDLEGNYDTRELLRALLADPALRIFMVPAVSNLVASPDGSDVNLSWTEPAELSEFVEYRVYRADSIMGDFQEIANGLTVESYTDSDAPDGPKIYMVQAVHLVEGGSGTILTNGQGAFAEVGLKMDTYLLPPFQIGEDIDFTFSASSATGTANWSIVSGQLPDGVSLSPAGVLSGNSVVAGEFPITVKLSDDSGFSLEREFVCYIDASFAEVIHMDLRQEGGLGLYDRVVPTRPITLMGDAHLDPVAGMAFDGDGDALRIHNIGDLSNGNWDDFSYTAAHARSSISVTLAFKAEPSSSGGVLISKSQDVSSDATLNNNYFTIRLNDSGAVEAWQSRYVKEVSADGFNDGEWHTVVYQFDDKEVLSSLYVDGVLYGQHDRAASTKPLDDLLVGARWDGPGESAITDEFDGHIADLRIYTEALALGEINALHERLVRSRNDLSPVAPVFGAMLPSVDIFSGTTILFPIAVSDANGDPLKLYPLFEDPQFVEHSEVVRTATGYALKIRVSDDFDSDSQLTLTVDDGYPGHVRKYMLDFRAGGPRDDTFAVNAEAFTELDVLANDSIGIGSSAVIESVTQPVAGTVRIVDGKLQFFPPPNFTRPLTFSYTLRDTASGQSSQASITVSPANKPLAVNDNFEHTGSDAVILDVLSNDSDALGEPLSLIFVAPPEFGSVRIVGDAVEYSPPAISNGPYVDRFTYRVRNSSGFIATALVSIAIDMTTNPLVRLEMEEGAGTILNNTGELGADVSGMVSGTISWPSGLSETALDMESGDAAINLGNPAALNFNPAVDTFSVSMLIDTALFSNWRNFPMTLLSKGRLEDGNAQMAITLGEDLSFFGGVKDVSIDIKGELIRTFAATPKAPRSIETCDTWHSRTFDWRHADDNLYQWSLFTLVNDAELKRLKVYINQWLIADVDTSEMDIDQGDNGADWIIGASPDGSGGLTSHFMGSMDEVRFYSRAITEADLRLSFEEYDFQMKKMAPYLSHKYPIIGVYPSPAPELEVGRPITLSIRANVDIPDELPGEVGRSVGVDYVVGQPYGTWVIRIDHNGTDYWLAEEVPGESIEITPFVTGKMYAYYVTNIFLNLESDESSRILESINLDVVDSAPIPPKPFVMETDSDLGNITLGESTTISLQLDGGTAPYSWTLYTAGLPAGMSLGSATGEITGTPTALGTHSFTVHFKDATSALLSRSYRLTVVSGDADGDNIPDDWEVSHFGSIAETGLGDRDRDGYSDIWEYVFGFDPLQSQGISPLEISETAGPMVDGSDRYLALKFLRRRPLGNLTYKIQCSVDMETWIDVNLPETILEDDGVAQEIYMSHPQGSMQKTFYRIHVQ